MTTDVPGATRRVLNCVDESPYNASTPPKVEWPGPARWSEAIITVNSVVERDPTGAAGLISSQGRVITALLVLRISMSYVTSWSHQQDAGSTARRRTDISGRRMSGDASNTGKRKRLVFLRSRLGCPRQKACVEVGPTLRF